MLGYKNSFHLNRCIQMDGVFKNEELVWQSTRSLVFGILEWIKKIKKKKGNR